MKSDRIDLGLTGYDELFMSTEERLDAKKPKVDELPRGLAQFSAKSCGSGKSIPHTNPFNKKSKAEELETLLNKYVPGVGPCGRS